MSNGDIPPGWGVSVPTPGTPYIVKSGDTFEGIASAAYGDTGEAENIRKANIGVTSLRRHMIINIPIVPGRVPIRTNLAAKRLEKKGKTAPTLIIDGSEITPQSITIFRSMNTASDGWSAKIPWKFGQDGELDKKLSPFNYTPAQVYIGGELIINGLLYIPAPELVKEGGAITLTGYSFAKDAVDSYLEPPYEHDNITLEQRARDVTAQLGIRTIFESSSGGPFDRITGSPTETIFKHLYKYAMQRGLVVTSSYEGDLLFVKASSIRVGTLKQGESRVIEWRSKYDGTKRFNAYKAIAQTPLGESEETAIDQRVPRSRFLNFRADDTISGNLKKAAEVRRNRAIIHAVSTSLKVSQWTAPNDTIWKDNTLIKVVSPQLFLPNGFEFIIKAVKLTLDNNGKSAELELTAPQAYNDEPIQDPWSV